jgi:ABC-type lipoprotein release transport system permease subunit
VTVIVIGITIGAAGSWLVMMDSAMGYMDEQIEADTWDLRVDFTGPLAHDSVNATSLGLEDSETDYLLRFSSLATEVRYRGNSEGAGVIACDQMARIRDFELREGELDFDGAVLTNKLADDLGAGPGDRISLNMGAKKLDLKVEGVVYDAIMHNVYTSRDTLSPLFPVANCSGVFVKLADPGDADGIAERMRSLPHVATVLVHADISGTLEEMMEMAEDFLFIFFIMNMLITIAVTASAVIISSMERDVEYATLDTLGVSRWQVSKSILVEMGSLAVMASAVGIPMSFLFAQALAVVMEDVIFYFPVVLAVGATMTIFVMGIAFVLLSSLVPIRYSGKLDTDRTIRERTAG